MPRPLFIPGKDPVPILHEAEWGPRTVLDRCGKSRPHRDLIPDRSACSQSLYRLSYRPTLSNVGGLKMMCKKVPVTDGLTDIVAISLANLSFHFLENTVKMIFNEILCVGENCIHLASG